jgi:hypothetical protein
MNNARIQSRSSLNKELLIKSKTRTFCAALCAPAVQRTKKVAGQPVMLDVSLSIPRSSIEARINIRSGNLYLVAIQM